MQADTIRINELQEIWQLKVDVLEKDKKILTEELQHLIKVT